MKAFERIFLYSVLAILFFYVFLVDGKVESKVAIQEEIRARSILIVNEAGQPVIMLWASEDGGTIGVSNKAGNPVAVLTVYKDDGLIEVYNKDGERISFLP